MTEKEYKTGYELQVRKLHRGRPRLHYYWADTSEERDELMELHGAGKSNVYKCTMPLDRWRERYEK